MLPIIPKFQLLLRFSKTSSETLNQRKLSPELPQKHLQGQRSSVICALPKSPFPCGPALCKHIGKFLYSKSKFKIYSSFCWYAFSQSTATKSVTTSIWQLLVSFYLECKKIFLLLHFTHEHVTLSKC